jgi:hypothetical protein
MIEWSVLLALIVIPVVMGIVYLIARRLSGDTWFGVLGAMAFVALYALASSGLLSQWWHVLLAAVGLGFVAGVFCLPFLLYTDLKKSLDAHTGEPKATAQQDVP